MMRNTSGGIANRTDLGEPQIEYRSTSWLWLLLATGLFVLFVGGAWAVLDCCPPFKPSDRSVWDWVSPVFLTGLACFMLCSWRRRRGLRIQVFESGFLHCCAGQSHAYRWDDVIRIWDSALPTAENNLLVSYMPPIFSRRPVKVLHRYMLEMSDGGRIRLHSTIRRVAELGDILQLRVFERLLPQALERLDKGESLEFGAVVTNQDGIHIGGDRLPWSEVDRVFVHGRFLAISRKDSWWRKSFLRVRRIPNVRLLLAVSRYRLTTPAQGETSQELVRLLLADESP